MLRTRNLLERWAEDGIPERTYLGSGQEKTSQTARTGRKYLKTKFRRERPVAIISLPVAGQYIRHLSFQNTFSNGCSSLTGEAV